MAKPTYKQAHSAIMALLAARGWTMSGNLKTPHATDPSGVWRLWFKPQAVYYSSGAGVKDFGSALSMWIDVRSFTAEQFLAIVEKDIAAFKG